MVRDGSCLQKKTKQNIWKNSTITTSWSSDTATKKATYANGEFPVNPNGAFHDIAGICNPAGTVFGLMPHPERAFYGWQLPDWTKTETVPTYGDGKLVFESMMEYLKKRF